MREWIASAKIPRRPHSATRAQHASAFNFQAPRFARGPHCARRRTHARVLRARGQRGRGALRGPHARDKVPVRARAAADTRGRVPVCARAVGAVLRHHAARRDPLRAAARARDRLPARAAHHPRRARWRESFRWSAIGANTRLPCNVREQRIVCAKPHRGMLAKVVTSNNQEWACRARAGGGAERAPPACTVRRARISAH